MQVLAIRDEAAAMRRSEARRAVETREEEAQARALAAAQAEADAAAAAALAAMKEKKPWPPKVGHEHCTHCLALTNAELGNKQRVFALIMQC